MVHSVETLVLHTCSHGSFIALGIWRHLPKHFPLAYDPLYWGMVFPLGMYTVCTLQLSKALALDFLLFIPRLFLRGPSCLAVNFVGLIHSLARRQT